MKKSELLKLLKEANVTATDLTELANKIEPNTNKYFKCNSCNLKFQSIKQVRKCVSCKSKDFKNITEEDFITVEHTNKNTLDKTVHNTKLQQVTQGKRQTRAVPIGQIKTQFFDDGTHHSEDTKFDKQTRNQPKVPRIRARFQLVKIKCATCNTTIEVNPAYITKNEGWECQLCLLSKIK